MKKNKSLASQLPFRKKLALNLFSRYRASQAESHKLTYLFWECTLRCNLNCIHCGSDCTKETQTPDMPLKDFLAVLDNVADYLDPSRVMVAITGGEPMLRKDLEECGLEITRRGFPWGMVTNAFALDENRLQSLVDAGLRSITLSMDGLSESHDWFRGVSGSYSRAEKAVRAVAARDDIVYDIATCVHHKNIEELETMYSNFLDAGVKRWRLFTIFAKGRASENPYLKPDKELLVRLFDFISKKRNEGRMILSYGCEAYLGNYEGEVRDSFFFCRAGINIGSVLADGSVSACPSLRNDFIQGNIYKDKFMDIWNKNFDNMRNRNWAKSGICEKCESWDWCNGSALHLRNEKDGSLMFCHLNELCS